MESEDNEQKKPVEPSADTDAYYGEDDSDMGDLDLSFLDDEDEA